MKIINKTGRVIIVFMQADGLDERNEVLEPGELSDDFFHFEPGDVIEIKFPKVKKKRRGN